VLRALLIFSLLLGSSSLRSETPVTGRAQYMLFSRVQVQAIAETAYGNELVRLANLGELDNDRVILARVRTASAHLIAQGIYLKPAAADWPWEIHVTSDDNVSAYAMAGGKILVGSRFVIESNFSDGELTVLLAHEIAHVIAEHVCEQISMAATFNPPPPNRHEDIEDVIYNMDSDIAVSLRLMPLSQLQELEADDLGIELAARTGTSSEAIDSFYKKISSDNNVQSILDTHGSSRERVKFVQSMLGYVDMESSEYTHQKLPTYIFH